MINFILLAFIAAAEDPKFAVNLEDKTEKFELKTGVETIGTVQVKAVFDEEPVGSPVQIEVRLKCAKGEPKGQLQKPARWTVWDYGSVTERTKLANFNAETKKLKVFFVTSKVDESGAVVLGGQGVKAFDLHKSCGK